MKNNSKLYSGTGICLFIVKFTNTKQIINSGKVYGNTAFTRTNDNEASRQQMKADFITYTRHNSNCMHRQYYID